MQGKYDVVIIGAGIGGLVCGCYLAKAGLKVLIVEKNDKPGGYCSSFERDGYRFDVGVHYLGGIKRGILGKILEELNLKDQIKFNQFDPTDKIIIPGNVTYIRANPYDTIKEFKKSFPDEKRNIERFFKFIMQRDFFNIYKKIRKLTFKEILDEFFQKNNIKVALNVLLSNLGLSAQEMAGLTGIFLYRGYLLDPGYYPSGGMQILPNVLSEEIRKCQGEFIFSKKVTKILTKNNEVRKVRIEGGIEIPTKIVVSNVDATQTFGKLLDIKSTEGENIKELIPSPSIFAVYLGLRINLNKVSAENCCIWKFNGDNMTTSFISSRKEIFNNQISILMVSFPSAHDHALTLKNRCVIEIFTVVSYESKRFWEKYKNIVSNMIIHKLKEILPLFKDKYIERKEIATPYTFEKHTLNRQGAVFGWASIPNQIKLSLLPLKTSIKGLFLTGNWTTIGSGQGGVPKVAYTGRKAAQLVLESIGKVWKYGEVSL